jgi:small-conductance mechanosensitive channel
MEEILESIAICVVLPVMIVWLINRTRQNEINRKTEIMLKAIESGATIDADFFKAQQEQKGPRTIKERLLRRLTGGCVFTLMGVAFTLIGMVNRSMMTDIHMSNDAFTMLCILGGIFFSIGVALLIVFFVGKKMLAKEMEAEAKALEQK